MRTFCFVTNKLEHEAGDDIKTYHTVLEIFIDSRFQHHDFAIFNLRDSLKFTYSLIKLGELTLISLP